MTVRTYELENGLTLLNVHDPAECEGRPCPIHNQSEHAKSIGRQHWRDDRGIMERICEHGVGHPDPDAPLAEGEGVHGCDGCCVR